MESETKLSSFLQTFREEAFLQSAEWRRFQQSEGKKTHHLESKAEIISGSGVATGFWANIIEHKLPIVGKYLYIPRGPITLLGSKEFPIKSQFPISNDQIKCGMQELVDLAEKEKAGWIRIDPRSKTDFELIRENITQKIVKAPHDMQPGEILVIDISKTEEELMMEMKSKTRYNVRLAEKKGIKVINSCHPELVSGSKGEMLKQVQHDTSFYVNEFLRLNKETAERDKITTHSDEHYRKMVEVLGEDVISLYAAEYNGKIIAANLVAFFEDTAIYLHGASSSENRDVMAPYLLQWKQIQDAKEKGCKYYDFGGIKTVNNKQEAVNSRNSWEGITRFKTGFSPKTEPIVFPGSYDIVVSPLKYNLYRGLQAAKAFLGKIHR